MSVSEFFKRWFGYSRRERSGSFILALILISVIVVRFTLFSSARQRDILLENNPQLYYSTNSGDTNLLTEALEKSPVLVPFDPNQASKEELVSLGLTNKQAGTVENYRQSGGVFRTPEDFRKIYGISDEQKDTLIRYIQITGLKESKSQLPATRQAQSGRAIEKVTGLKYEDTAPENSAPLVELNRADSTELVRLKGIGKVLSVRIIKYRNLLGGYVDLDQLHEVYGIDSSMVNSLRGIVFIDTSLVRRIDINRAGFSEMVRHPYINSDQTGSIIRYRSVAGSFTGPGDLVINKIFKEAEYERLKPYIICW